MFENMNMAQMIPMMFSAFGTGMSASAKRQAGAAAEESGMRKKAAADFEAAQLEANAGQQMAAAERSAMEERRQATLAQSRALAVAAASGGGASDPTIVNLISRLAGEGTYRSMVALYNGKERALSMERQAAATRYAGDTALADARTSKSASDFGSIATALTGAASMYSRFGKMTDPSVSASPSGYQGTWTANGPLDMATYNGQIWD